jgi:Na+-transporting NADH:ubiquinone oxidoreductase subunit C
MVSANRFNLWRRFLAAPNDSAGKTLVVALLVALASSLVVSFTAVTLKPLQVANLERERQARLAAMIATLPGMEEILREAGAESLEVRVVDLSTGTYATDIDPATYDQRAAAADPDLSQALSPDTDIAGLKRRANFAPVYLIGSAGAPALVVLPVHGSGYQSTLYGYLALEGDANTVAGLTFYEQGDSPGMGARVEEAEWQALWAGKSIADETGRILIAVVQGKATGPYQVDGISGATRTSDGVTNLLQFWLGENGFGPFLTLFKAGEI